MNNTFDTNRFLLLMRRQWIGFGKIYLMSIAVVAGIILAFYGYNTYRNVVFYEYSDTLSFRPFVFVFLGLGYMAVSASSYFSALGTKSKAISEILVPGSQLEKFLAGILYTVFFCGLSFLAVFFAIDYSFVTYFRGLPSVAKTSAVDHLEYFISIFSSNNNKVFYTFFLPFLLSAIFLVGSIAFKSYQFIRTAVSVIAYGSIWIFCNVYITQWANADTVYTGTPGYWNEEENVLRVVCIIGIILTAVFWGIAYLKLKEKEV